MEEDLCVKKVLQATSDSSENICTVGHFFYFPSVPSKVLSKEFIWFSSVFQEIKLKLARVNACVNLRSNP